MLRDLASSLKASALLAALGALAPMLSGCGDVETRLKHLANASAVEFTEALPDGETLVFDDATVPEEQQAALRGDFERVRQIDWKDPTGELARALGVDRADGATLDGWLRSRVRYIVGPRFGEQYVVKSGVTYNPVPFSSTGPAVSLGEGEETPEQTIARSLMINLSSALYIFGKAKGALTGVRIGGENVLITSPRAGILQIGGQLFTDEATEGGPLRPAAPGSGDASIGASFLRIAVLFHEARHGDGHDENAGFPHAVCPSSDPDRSERRERHECESHGNGPYAIELLVVRELIRFCGPGCKASDLKLLTEREKGLKDRLLPGADRDRPDPDPEKI